MTKHIRKTLLQDALIAVRRHCSDPVNAWLQQDSSLQPTQLARFASDLQIDPSVGNTTCEHFDNALDCVWLVQQVDGAFEKEWYEPVLPSTSIIFPKAAWNTQVEHWQVVMTRERVRSTNLKRFVSIFTDEITWEQLAAHELALAAELKNVGKDLFETTEPRKVTVTYSSILFPGLVTVTCLR